MGWALLGPRLPGSQWTPEMNLEAQDQGGAGRARSSGSAPLHPELPEVRQSVGHCARWYVTVTHSWCGCVYTPPLE